MHPAFRALAYTSLLICSSSACALEDDFDDELADEAEGEADEAEDTNEDAQPDAEEALPGPGMPCADEWHSVECAPDSDEVSMCSYMESSETMEYGPCLAPAELECQKGFTMNVTHSDELCDYTSYECQLIGGVPEWVAYDDGCFTPLVLRFDDAPIEMLAAEATPMATFDINMAEHTCVSTDWPTAVTPWLVADLDGSGFIEGGNELFGSGTRLPSGERAAHGFAALAPFDSNADGVIDSSDARFDELMLWRDYDADRVSSFDELEPLAEAGVPRLELDYRVERECDERGNCGVQRSSFEFAGGQRGELVDLYLACH